MKRRIILTEGDLHRIVKESVKRLIKEWEFDRYELDDTYNEWDVSECSKFVEYFVPNEGLTNDESDPNVLPVSLTLYPIVELNGDEEWEIVDFYWEFNTNDESILDKLTNKYGDEIEEYIKNNFESMKRWTEIKTP
jgi:hypothetical protein